VRGAGQAYAVALVLPVKAFDRAKSRLSLPACDRRRVAEALAHRSIRTATSCLPDGRVQVVTDEPAAADLAGRYGASVVADDGRGLNAACAAGWAAAQAAWPQFATAVLVSDLHLLTRDDLAWLLHRTSHASRPGFVPDRHGTGTTFVGAPPGTALPRAFGRRSAARFARGGYAEIVAAPPALRSDLDTIHDLAGGPGALASLLDGRSSAL
jgi:2-phospho-L-lactate/phosphoenolpyruvate guanylyltransferase